jgi:hypothetical protein
MTVDPGDFEGPRPSTENGDALAAYCDGLAALVAGNGHAESLLLTAVQADPDFALAHIALGVARTLRGVPSDAPLLPSTASRAERQHAEIVRTALRGDPARADDLRREHLTEFPGDLLVIWLPVLRRAPRVPEVG